MTKMQLQCDSPEPICNHNCAEKAAAMIETVTNALFRRVSVEEGRDRINDATNSARMIDDTPPLKWQALITACGMLITTSENAVSKDQLLRLWESARGYLTRLHDQISQEEQRRYYELGFGVTVEQQQDVEYIAHVFLQAGTTKDRDIHLVEAD